MEDSERARLLRKLDDCNLTDFQKDVLRATLDIPRGEVRTYKQIAEAVGHPKAYRAVGTALKKNPLAPQIPCHRVIKSNGELGSYSGDGGKKRKMELLSMEGSETHFAA
jgi:methylated-DNA-[protein]-cysteine S-methyltransferase